MILYENTVENFTLAMKSRNLIAFITDEYYARTSRKVSPFIRGTWKYTLEVLKQLLDSAEINPECGIRIDYVMLDTNNRFEVIIAGNNKGESIISIIEMLSWENVRYTDELDIVSYDSGEACNRKCVHPSFLSISYKKYFSKSLRNMNIFSDVYLFECSRNTESIQLIDKYKALTQEAPIYFAEESELLSKKLSIFKTCKRGIDILNEFHERDQLSSNGVDAFLTSVVSNKELGILSDDQKIIIASVIKNSEEHLPVLILVNGNPGTGKTMLAISCMVELRNRGKKAIYLTSMRALCDMLQHELKKRSDFTYNVDLVPRFRNNQEKSFQKYDVIFVDEAQNLFPDLKDCYSDPLVLKTIMESGTVIVFLQDITQIIDKDMSIIKKEMTIANEYKKTLKQYDLNRNMRYAGKGSGIHWLAHQFQIADTGNYEDWDSDSFPICIVDTPQELLQHIKANSDNNEPSRVLVRYRYLSELEYDEVSNELNYSIPEYAFKIPVCTVQRGMSRNWYQNNQYIDYAVGPNLSQGFEFNYVGVIIGKELSYDKESGKIVINHLDETNNSYNVQIIKRAYFVLLSRGKKGVYIFIQDPSLKEMISERVSYASRRFSWIKELAKKYQPSFEKKLIDKQDHRSSYSYAIFVYKAVNEFIANLKRFSEDQLDGDKYKEVSDQCSQLLLRLQSDPLNQTEIWEKYQNIIIRNMGESAWNKLSEIGRKCLISSELTYHDMKDYNQLYDFSSVCVQVSKAVEYELTNRYYCPYITYLETLHDRTKYPNAFYNKIPAVLKKQERGRDRLLKEQEVTLGTIPFIVGLNMEGKITDKDAFDSFKGYAIKLLLQGLDVKSTLAKHIKYIIRIKNDYRNKAAHKNPMDVVTAKACLDYVVEVQRTLGQMLDDYIK